MIGSKKTEIKKASTPTSTNNQAIQKDDILYEQFQGFAPVNGEKKYTISYNKDRFTTLSQKYKYLCSLSKENATDISKIIKYKLKTQYEDSYSIYIDSQDGTLIFVHPTLICFGAAAASNVEYADVIQFDKFKELLSYEMNYYKTLIARWEDENDLERANSCKEHLQTLERIINVYLVNWKNLINV